MGLVCSSRGFFILQTQISDDLVDIDNFLVFSSLEHILTNYKKVYGLIRPGFKPLPESPFSIRSETNNEKCTTHCNAILVMQEELTDYVVTRWYRAPELMLQP